MKTLLAYLAFAFTLGGMAYGQSMTFQIEYRNHTNIVIAEGEITRSTPVDFQRFLDTEPLDGFQFYVDLNSPGGDLIGGMKLGQIIRERKLSTRIASHVKLDGNLRSREGRADCFSACALAFLGGATREIPNGSLIGFHQFSQPEPEGKTTPHLLDEGSIQLVSGLVHDYILSMGGSSELYSQLTQTPADQMFIPESSELMSLGVVSPTAFQNFVLVPKGRGVAATSSVLSNASGRNVVSRVTAYCRQKVPYLLLSQPDHYKERDESWLQSVNYSLNGFRLFRRGGGAREYPISEIRATISGSEVAELRLDPDGVQFVIQGASGSVHIAAFVLMHFEIKPTESDRDALETAFSLCIE